MTTTEPAVPEQIEVAGKAAWKAFAAIPDDSNLTAPQMWSLMGVAALAEAMPSIAASVRAQVAREIEQVASDRSYDSAEPVTEAYLSAARIARGNTA